MTILQNIAIVAIVIILEIFIVFISSVFSENNEGETTIGMAVFKGIVLIAFLLI